METIDKLMCISMADSWLNSSPKGSVVPQPLCVTGLYLSGQF